MKRLRPTLAAMTDAGLLMLLCSLALLGFRNTFAGWTYLVVGCAGVALGLVVSYLLRALRQPVIVVAAALVVVFFALASPIVLPDEPQYTVDTIRLLSVASIYGWKQLLTTVPPVDASGPLLVVPFILGLLGGAIGYLLAQPLRRPDFGDRWRVARAIAPVGAPILVLGLVIAFGTTEPAAQLLGGTVFGAVCLYWTAMRLRAQRPPAKPSSADRTRSRSRVPAAAGVLAVAAAGGMLAGPMLPGAASDRVVLREVVVPPFDLRAYPSPLVGFRKYTKDANQLWDQTLFTVSGLPQGAPIRIASLDDYDGSVWGAADNRFNRVGATVGPAGAGPHATVRITIEPAYAATTDLNPWLPNVGSVSEIDFGGERQVALADSFRYNRAAASGIVAARLQAGDSYTLRTSLAAVVIPPDAQPYTRPNLTESAQSLLGSRIASWTEGATGLTDRLRAVAQHLQRTGAYSDGGPGETQYLPGHSTGRLSSFFNAAKPVGDDEQYAAAYALIANHLGIPARVVFGAQPQADGAVRGGDIHAWVEVHLADGSWAMVPQNEFMPDVSKKPDQQDPPQEVENTDAAVVPPPNAARQPLSRLDTGRTDQNQIPPPPPPCWQNIVKCLWDYVRPAVVWGGPPVLLVSTVCLTILWLKARRRRRRRHRGSTANRFAGAWRELVDQVRDLGTDFPRGQTRLQEAELVSVPLAADLAGHADRAVYGPGDPTGGEVADFWKQMDGLRRELKRGVNRWRRLRASLSLRSLRPQISFGRSAK